MSIKATKFWRKTYGVEAIRVTPENLKELADLLNADSIETGPNQSKCINLGGMPVVIGDWVVHVTENFFSVFSHEDFVNKFWTHSEREAGGESDKYARIFALVRNAMVQQDAITYHGDGSNAEMDRIAVETVQKIMGEL